MSFLGSIAGPLRKVLASYADEVSVPVLLPCAGNFTVGAALRSGGYQGRITGCDITLYTSALGAYIAGDTLPVTESEDCPEHLRGFLDCSDAAHLAASVSIMLDLRQVWQNKKRLASAGSGELSPGVAAPDGKDPRKAHGLP